MAQQPPMRVPYAPEPVRLDGRLLPEEWEYALVLQLNRREQVWDEKARGAWGGVDDLSATLYVSYDAAHLYLAGEVRDNSFVGQQGGARWETGDAIELFLNLDLTDDQPGAGGKAASTAFDGDDIQLFLMPFHDQRPWGQVAWDGRGGRHSATGSTMTGVRVAFQTLDAQRYAFEAQVPFHSLFGVDRAPPSRMGFSVAIDDHDQGSTRYQYMTLDGRNPVDNTSHLSLIEFAGAPPLVEATKVEGSSLARVRSWVSVAAGPLAAAAALWFLLRAWSSVNDRRPRARRLGRVVAGVAFVIGLLLPRLALDWRERAHDAELAGVLATLRTGIPEMEKGTLASYAGTQREQQLTELLRGNAIPRRRYFDYVELVEVAEGAFGYGPRRYPGEFFDVRPYFIPLAPARVERIDFGKPVAGQRLHRVE